MPTSRCDTQAGFTLVELLVVIVILALLSAGAAQYLFRTDPGFEIRQAAADIETTLRQARSKALVENRSVAIVFDLSNRSYVAGQQRTVLPDAYRLRVVVAGREQVASSAGAIRFYPDGAATGGAVYLSDAVETVAIEVDWLTGRVVVADATP